MILEGFVSLILTQFQAKFVLEERVPSLYPKAFQLLSYLSDSPRKLHIKWHLISQLRLIPQMSLTRHVIQ